MSEHVGNWTRLNGEPGGGPGVHIARLRWVIDQLEALGEPVGRGSRIRNALALLEREREAKPAPAVRPREFALVAEAIRTAWELQLILVAVIERGGFDGPFTRDRIRVLDGGAALPKEDAQPATARNTQFELYVAAMFATGGYTVRAGEDMEVEWEGEWLTVQAKRLVSLRDDALPKRLAKAAVQIGGADTSASALRVVRSRGLIVLSVDNRIPDGELSPEFAARVPEYEEAYAPVLRAMRVLEEHPHVLGVLAIGCHTEFSPADAGGGTLPVVTTTYAISSIALQESPLEESLARAMMGTIRTRLQDVVRKYEFKVPKSVVKRDQPNPQPRRRE